MSECRNTNKTLHENVDCRILWTEQHRLGIDVGGHVIVKDPVQWHELTAINAELLAACEAAVDCGMVPSSSVSDGGAVVYAKQVHVADQVRAAIAKAKEDTK